MFKHARTCARPTSDIYTHPQTDPHALGYTGILTSATVAHIHAHHTCAHTQRDMPQEPDTYSRAVTIKTPVQENWYSITAKNFVSGTTAGVQL